MHKQNVPRKNFPRYKTFKDKTSQDIRSQGPNVPSDKASQGQNVPRTKRPKGKNVPKGPTLITKFSKTNFVSENWPQMYTEYSILGNELNLWIGVILTMGRLG